MRRFAEGEYMEGGEEGFVEPQFNEFGEEIVGPRCVRLRFQGRCANGGTYARRACDQ